MAGFWDFLGANAPGAEDGVDLGDQFPFLTSSGTPASPASSNLAALVGASPSAPPQGNDGGMPALRQVFSSLPGGADRWTGVRPMIASDLGASSTVPFGSAANIWPAVSAVPQSTGAATPANASPGPGPRGWADVSGRLSDFFNAHDAPAMLMAMAGGFGGARSLGEGLGRAASNTAAVMSRLDRADMPELRQIGTSPQGQPIWAWVNRRTRQITPIASR